MDDATLAALRTAASALFDIGFATMVGALAVRVLVADVPSGRGLRCLRRCRRLFLAACLGALAASLAWLEVQAITMTELPPGAALLASGDLVAHTQFGRAWALAVALGGFNRLAVMPALPGAWPRFARVLRVEAVVLLAALVAAALLANGAPPAP